MSQWDFKYLQLLKTLKIIVDLYRRYVDDTVQVVPPINPGWDYCLKSKIMIYDHEKAIADTDQPAVRMAKVLQKIANSLETDIQMTYDVPENHLDGKMPVLDLKIWVNNNKIFYTFYKKDVSSKYTVLKRSALSHLNRFSWTMKLSGYNEFDRYHAISGAIKRVNSMKDEVRSGVRDSSFRNRQQIVESKRNKKDWTNTWFLRGNTVGTISCPVTPGGVLKKTLNK